MNKGGREIKTGHAEGGGNTRQTGLTDTDQRQTDIGLSARGSGCVKYGRSVERA